MNMDKPQTPETIRAIEAKLPRYHAEITAGVAQDFEKILTQLESPGGNADTDELMGRLVKLFQVRATEENGGQLTGEEKEAIDSALQELAEWHRKRGVKIEEIRKRLKGIQE